MPTPDLASRERALLHARRHLDDLSRQSVAATASREELWNRLARPLPEIGTNPVQVIADLISHCCRHAGRLATEIGSLPGAELVWKPQLNQGLVRFLDPNPLATPEDHDRRTDRVMERILKSGEAFFSGTTFRGRRCMRISVCNWRTSDADIDRTVKAVGEVLL